MTNFYHPLKAFVSTICLSLSLIAICAEAQNVPVKAWDKTFGGKHTENLTCLAQTPDGGYLLGGNSGSDSSGHKTQNSFGNSDYWLVKVDARGNKVWDKTFGGSGPEVLQTLIQTADGGWVLGGSSKSPVGGSKSQPCAGDFDYWVVKLDENGTKIWDKTLGGSGYDYLYSLEEAADGSIVVGGVSESSLSKPISQDALPADFWVVKLKANGDKIWEKSFGKVDSESDEPYVLRLLPDGGYILGGSLNNISSKSSKVSGKGGSDYCLTRFDANANPLWEKTYGGSNDEFFSSLEITENNSFVLGGISYSGKSGDKSEAARGQGDFWVIKVNADGQKIWDRTYGGTEYDYMTLLQKTPDEGLVLGGISRSGSSSDKTEMSYGKTDYWLVRLDAGGSKVWDQTYGGAKEDNLYAVKQTADGGYLLAGHSGSSENEIKTETGQGDKDFWLVKLRAQVYSWYSR